MATTFAAQATTALENARLYQETDARAEKLRTLSQLTRLMTSAQDSGEVFHAVARAATLLLSAVTTRVWVADPGARVLRTRASFGVDAQVEALMTDSSTTRAGSIGASQRREASGDSPGCR